ncbi:MAG: glycosyltransferase, partial [Chloroflexota bacterium]|nr:glycosyltransferase [Chloroflexota bacterium]
MKILQVINFFSPLHGGGSIEVAYQLSKHLAQRGHEVVIYTSDYELDQDYINSLSNIEICPFRACSLFGQWPLTPSLFRKVKNHLREFDIVHMHNYPTFQNVAVHHYANKHRIPYVLGAYGSMVQYSNRWLKEAFGLLFGHRIIRDASKLLAMTPFEANQYQDQGIDSDRIVEVPNCIDISKFDHLPEKGTFRNEFNINEDHIVLFLGRIHKIKGLDILVQAVAKLVQEGKNLRLVVIGPD